MTTITTALTTITTADRPFHVLGAEVVPLAEAARTGGSHEVFRLELDAGAASPLHTVSGSKLFTVLGGEVVIVLGALSRTQRPGESVFVSAGTPHRYVNRSGAPARLLVVTGGDRQLAFLRGMGALGPAARTDPDRVRAHAERHGVRLLPPE